MKQCLRNALTVHLYTQSDSIYVTSYPSKAYRLNRHLSIKKLYLPLCRYTSLMLNPLSPHDALKHHFTSLKTDLIFLQLRVLKQKN